MNLKSKELNANRTLSHYRIVSKIGAGVSRNDGQS